MRPIKGTPGLVAYFGHNYLTWDEHCRYVFCFVMDAFFLLKQVLAGQIHQVINDCFSGERYFLDDEDGFFSPVFSLKQ
ncbi:MAG TPA: hypothetical protein EYQ57_03470 [Methylococcaceae bacterium]|nr:hypothetical protein [Methylococcaceae bacterium]